MNPLTQKTRKSFLTLDFWSEFFMGRLYPLIVALLVLFGNISGLDYYLNFLVTGLFVFSMIISDSARPAIITVCTYVYQVSLKHGTNYPTYSDFFYTGWRLPVSIIIICLIAFSFAFFIVKNKLYKKLSFKKTPLLIPLLLFSASLLLGGAFSGKWVGANLLFSFSHIMAYLFLFLFFYSGFSDEESRQELTDYFVYVALLIGMVLVGEVAHLFLTSDNIFIDGSINKVGVALGWGIWNLVGVSLSVLIPVLFLGAMKSKKYFLVYFFAASAVYITAVLTMSRNALVFSTLAYGASLLIACFFGENKKRFRILTACAASAVIIFAVLFFDKISSILLDYFERGFSDNGRYSLWRQAFDNFLNSPIFGNGFYGFDVETAVFGPLPKMAHNTVLQLLSSSGIVGLIAYLYYRISTVKLFVRKPDITKTMLALSALVLIFGGLLDNFIFNVYPTFFYTVMLAIVARDEKT